MVRTLGRLGPRAQREGTSVDRTENGRTPKISRPIKQYPIFSSDFFGNFFL